MTPEMLHQARQKIAAAKLQNIELIEADAEHFNFTDSSFDVVFCCEAIVLFLIYLLFCKSGISS